jgi:recombination protein RecR
MDFTTGAMKGLIEEFARLPGIGHKTAERLAYHVLRTPVEEASKLADAIRHVKETIRQCRRCFNFCEEEICPICADETREAGQLCIVEHAKDLHAIERSGSYRGRYHVLLGAFSPLDGTAPEDLTLSTLFKRLRNEEIVEVILATNPSFEGEGTALYIREKLKSVPRDIRITRIARGMPSGSHLEHVGRNIVADALEGRREME